MSGNTTDKATRLALEEMTKLRAKAKAARDALAAKLVKQGEDVRTIATRMGMSVDSARELLRRLGLWGGK